MTTYTTKQAGEILGLAHGTVKSYCQRHPGIGQKIGRDWILTDADLDRIRERRGKVGKPAGTIKAEPMQPVGAAEDGLF